MQFPHTDRKCAIFFATFPIALFYFITYLFLSLHLIYVDRYRGGLHDVRVLGPSTYFIYLIWYLEVSTG